MTRHAASASGRGALHDLLPGVVARPPPVHQDNRLLSYHPSVVSLRESSDIARYRVKFLAVGHQNMKFSRDMVLKVRGLAPLRFRDRLDVLSPPPTGLQRQFPHHPAAPISFSFLQGFAPLAVRQDRRPHNFATTLDIREMKIRRAEILRIERILYPRSWGAAPFDRPPRQPRAIFFDTQAVFTKKGTSAESRNPS